MNYDREYFKGKTALVTGAASGIGLEIVKELFSCGATQIVLADINKEHLDARVEELNAQYGDRARGILCDVTDEKNVQDLIKQSAEFFEGSFDLLFNNAGALFYGWFEEVDNAEWKAAFDLNFYAAVYSMRAVIPIMKAQGGGQIVNVISGTAFSPLAYWSPYAATKAALNALTLSIRAEFCEDNILISSATPGTTSTAIWDESGTPGTAQTPQEAVTRMLLGVTNNERLIFGDDSDAAGASTAFAVFAQKGVDTYMNNVARERQAGNLLAV